MANYTTSADIIDDALERVGEKTDGTSDFNSLALTFLNRIYHQICAGGTAIAPEINENWWWLYKRPPRAINLTAVVTTGTVSVTQNSTSITFSSGPSASAANWHLKIDGKREVYRISSHTAGATAATLDTAYTDATNTAANYKLFQLEYNLVATDIFRLVSPFRVFKQQAAPHRHDGRINIVSPEELDIYYPIRDVTQGTPVAAAPILESDGSIIVRFSHYVGELTRVEFDYLVIPTDLTDDASSTPLVPRMYRHLLADGVVWLLGQIKGDSIADAGGLMLKNGLMAMAKENQVRWQNISGDFGRIFPRAEETNTMRPGTVRTSSGMVLM